MTTTPTAVGEKDDGVSVSQSGSAPRSAPSGSEPSGRVTSSDVVNALIYDRNPASGWMTASGKIIEPRSEIWLADAQMWVRADGMRASGWRGNDYFAEWFGWLARLRIRQAVRRWVARRYLPNGAISNSPRTQPVPAAKSESHNHSEGEDR